MLSSAQEDIKHWAIGRPIGHYRRLCPFCSHTRVKKHERCLSVEVKDNRAIYICWHGDCGEKGVVLFEEKKAERPAPMVQRTTGAVKHISHTLDTFALDWLKKRGISEATAKTFKVVAAQAFFPAIKRNTAAVAFPYIDNDRVVGHKVRSVEDKANVCDRPLTTLCGLHCVDMEEEASLTICEGEPDMLAMGEAGVLNATSVPNGASSFTANNKEGDDQTVFGFLWSAKDIIDKAKKVYIATDNDAPGEKLADELARRIGRHKCWKVEYPDGCKDANDTLLRHGGEVLKACVDTAKPWPVAGLYEAETFFPQVRELFTNGYGERVKTGISDLDEYYSIEKGMLTVVTGIPANGKSTFVDQLMLNAARLHGSTFAVCSFENPIHVHIAKLSEMLVGKHFFQSDLPGPVMEEDELEGALPFIHRHFKFMQQEDGAKADIESIIERIKTAVFRWGVRGAVIDPYNYIQRPKSAESETQWIDDVLTRIRLLAQAYDLHIWFIAHPTKLVSDSEGNYPPPRGYSISGSGSWYSKADFGLTVHRERNLPGVVRIINWKTRWHWLGKEGEVSLLWDNVHHCYMTGIQPEIEPYNGDMWYD